MKLVFIGASHFGLRYLELVCGLPEVRVTGVVTAPPAGTLTLRPQDENKRRIMPQRAPEDGRIDWAQDAIANRNRKHPGWCKKRAAALP